MKTKKFLITGIIILLIGASVTQNIWGNNSENINQEEISQKKTNNQVVSNELEGYTERKFPYDGVYHDANGELMRTGIAKCNIKTGYVGVAVIPHIVGGVKARALQRVDFYTGRSKDLYVKATIHRTGCAYTWGIGSFASTRKIWVIDDFDSGYHYDDIDHPFSFETLASKTITIASLLTTGGVGNIIDAIKIIGLVNSAYKLYQTIDMAKSSGDIETITVEFPLTASKGSHSIWIGLGAIATVTPTGYSHAFNWGVIDNVKIYGYTKPNMPVIKGKTSINLDESYEISVSATDIDNDKISYHVNWGDGTSTQLSDYYLSGQSIKLNHKYKSPGNYQLIIEAIDNDFLISDCSTHTVEVVNHDTPPDTSITNGPTDTVNYKDVTFRWIGIDSETPSNQIVYSYKLQGYDNTWSSWTANTKKIYYNLPDGSYTFQVKAKDKSGNIDTTPAKLYFTVKEIVYVEDIGVTDMWCEPNIPYVDENVKLHIIVGNYGTVAIPGEAFRIETWIDGELVSSQKSYMTWEPGYQQDYYINYNFQEAKEYKLCVRIKEVQWTDKNPNNNALDSTIFVIANQPSINLREATEIKQTSSILNCDLISTGGSLCDIWFEYGKTANFGYITQQKTKQTSGQVNIPISNLEPNQLYYFRAIAQNCNSIIKSTTLTFKTTQNIFPVANTGGPYEGKNGVEILFDGSKSYDKDGTIIGYRWDWTSDGVWDTTWQTKSITSHKYENNGEYSLALQVKDNDDNTDIDYTNVIIQNNNPSPEIPSKPSGIGRGYLSKKYNFTTSTTDPDNDLVRYGWDWNGDKIVDQWTDFQKSGQRIITTHTWENVGKYNIQVMAKDRSGLKSSFSEPLTIEIIKESVEETYDFSEEFETGYDGWYHNQGNILFANTQNQIKNNGNSAFKLTGKIGETGGYAGQYKYNLNIPVVPNLKLNFAYYFPTKDISYVGYRLQFNSGKSGNYFSLFSGCFVNTSKNYLHQYKNEKTNTWHQHQVNVYDSYKNGFGSVPSDLKIISISMIMGDPYFTGKTQTAYYDSITITKEENINNPPNKPITPLGISSGYIGKQYAFSTKSIDVDNDDIKYGWDWNGDNIVDQWTSFHKSGQTITNTHIWTTEGIYNIRVKAMDSKGAQSPWSNSITITIKQDQNYKFIEDFETGSDGWQHAQGDIIYAEVQNDIIYEGNSAFKLTGIIGETGGYAGNYKHDLNLPVKPNMKFKFNYYFPSKDISYIGYRIYFNTGKSCIYFSLFSGNFINTDKVYLHQYKNENTNTWHYHEENIYNDYQQGFGDIPSDLHITSISMMMGDPYFTGKTQTAYYDSINIT